jgi:hypothetical protein
MAGVQLLAKAQECVSHIHGKNEWLLFPSSPLCSKCQGVFDKKLLLVDEGKVAKLDKTEIFPGTAVLLFITKKTGVRPISRISGSPNIMHKIRIAQMYLDQAAAFNSTSIKPADASKLYKKWCTLFNGWNKNNQSQVYFVQTDIGCFWIHMS